MSHQFKSGDLALIAGASNGVSPNIGMSVELIQKLSTNDQFMLPDGRLLKNRGPASWLVEANGLSASLHSGGRVDLGGIALVEERHLIPLQGDFAPTEQKSQAIPA
jgi:hypothetical protein